MDISPRRLGSNDEYQESRDHDGWYRVAQHSDLNGRDAHSDYDGHQDRNGPLSGWRGNEIDWLRGEGR